MTRDEFMDYAEREIDAVINPHKNRLMDVVYRAWMEKKEQDDDTD